MVVAVAGTTAGCDQSTKLLAGSFLDQSGPIDLAGGLLHLEFVLNRGGFLGLGGDLSPSVRWWLFTFGIGLALLLVLRMAMSRGRPAVEVVGLALILGGGIGNLLDRLLLSGAVRDFAIVGFGWLRTGVFNLADATILLGVAILLLACRMWGRGNPENSEDENEQTGIGTWTATNELPEGFRDYGAGTGSMKVVRSTTSAARSTPVGPSSKRARGGMVRDLYFVLFNRELGSKG